MKKEDSFYLLIDLFIWFYMKWRRKLELNYRGGNKEEFLYI